MIIFLLIQHPIWMGLRRTVVRLVLHRPILRLLDESHAHPGPDSERVVELQYTV